jgi:ElaA protein
VSVPSDSAARAGAPAAAPAVRWSWREFAELSPAELYEVLALRQRVFVVEQTCPYLDADGWDDRAGHLLGWVDGADGRPMLGAYVRIFGAGVKYAEASIGRVVTSPLARRTGLGRVLMTEAIRRTEALAPGAGIRIGAQRYLEAFYASLGFRTVSAPYDEDGIEHVEMVKPG